MSNPVYRAVVSYSNENTGEVLVQIPALTGYDSTVSVSQIARTAYNGTWVVPPIGSQIVVTADDENLTNLFWVQVNPSKPLSGAEADINNLSTSLSALAGRVTDLESYRDASMLGIFN